MGKKRGRKRKSATEGTDAPEPKGKVARTGETQVTEVEQEAGALELRAKVVQMSEAHVKPWRAPVARMW